jgi:hypothetical protein
MESYDYDDRFPKSYNMHATASSSFFSGFPSHARWEDLRHLCKNMLGKYLLQSTFVQRDEGYQNEKKQLSL